MWEGLVSSKRACWNVDLEWLRKDVNFPKDGLESAPSDSDHQSKAMGIARKGLLAPVKAGK